MMKIHPRREKRLKEAKLKKAINEYIWEAMEIRNVIGAGVLVKNQAAPLGAGGIIAGIGGESASVTPGSFVSRPATDRIYTHKRSGRKYTEQTMNDLKKLMGRIVNDELDWAVMMLDNDPIIREFATYVYKRV